jgi:hypothetical protein
MEQTREPILAPDAQKIISKAAGLTQTALASDMGRTVRTVIQHGPEGLLQKLSRAAQHHVSDPLGQLRTLVAEQGQHFEQLRASITQMGQSLAALGDGGAAAPGAERHRSLLMNAQAEAIQGLTFLAIKGQQVQSETVRALEIASHQQPAPAQHLMQKWIYYLIGLSVIWSMLGMIF